MTTNFIYIVVALLAGTMIASQSLINAQLASVLNSPIWAAFTSFFVGTILLFVLAYVMTGKLPSLEGGQFHWWMLAGGVLGAFFVTTSITIVPHLGVTAMITLFVAGQLVMALILDHYGVLAAVAHPITLKRLIGVVFLFVGAMLTQRI